jgi:hypothetical protein
MGPCLVALERSRTVGAHLHLVAAKNRSSWHPTTRFPGLSSTLSPYFFPPVFLGAIKAIEKRVCGCILCVFREPQLVHASSDGVVLGGVGELLKSWGSQDL